MNIRRLLKFATIASLPFVSVWVVGGFVVLNWDVTTWNEYGRMALVLSPLVIIPLYFAVKGFGAMWEMYDE